LAAAGPRCSENAPYIAPKPAWASRRSHTWTATVPPSVTTRAISPSAPARSGKNIRADWQRTTSKDPDSKGSAAASPWRHSMSERSRRATASMPSLRSRPTTRPRPAIRSAAVRATTPVPQATSSTAWPPTTPAASTRWGAHSAKIAGTNLASYTSAASTDSW
jgi:hypothetical protein